MSFFGIRSEPEDDDDDSVSSPCFCHPLRYERFSANAVSQRTVRGTPLEFESFGVCLVPLKIAEVSSESWMDPTKDDTSDSSNESELGALQEDLKMATDWMSAIGTNVSARTQEVLGYLAHRPGFDSR